MPILRASIKLLLFTLLCLIFLPFQYAFIIFRHEKATFIGARFWHKVVCLIFKIRIKRSGEIYKKTQTLYVSNHLSYLDIVAIGSILKGCFIGKEDIAEWPVFSTLAKLQHTVFVSRNPTKAKQEGANMSAALNKGRNIILFPEGTSTIGDKVRPFKSSPFSIVENSKRQNIMIQPISLSLLHVDKKTATTEDLKNIYAWHTDIDTPLEQHLWNFMKSRGATLDIHFHAPLSAENYENRKTLAKACHKVVSNHLLLNQN